MYDKVKFWMDRAIIGEHYPIIANYLDNANTQTNLQTGEVKTFGSLEGLRISIFVGGLSVVGSLPKFLYGNNVYHLDKHAAKTAIEKMSDILHLEISSAIVTGFEFGTNFLMQHPVTEYLTKLGDIPRLSRYNFDQSTLYYKGVGRHQSKVFAFYDKIADAKAKKMAYPQEWSGANLLRYEMRFNGRLPKQLKVSEVKASTLSNDSFYRMLVKRYQDTYFSISKQTQIKTNVMSEIKNVSDAFNVFVARLINQSGQTQVSDFVNELKNLCVFDDRKNYTRLKKKIEEIATKSNIMVSDELIKELDDEIKNTGAYV